MKKALCMVLAEMVVVKKIYNKLTGFFIFVLSASFVLMMGCSFESIEKNTPDEKMVTPLWEYTDVSYAEIEFYSDIESDSGEKPLRTVKIEQSEDLERLVSVSERIISEGISTSKPMDFPRYCVIFHGEDGTSQRLSISSTLFSGTFLGSGNFFLSAETELNEENPQESSVYSEITAMFNKYA